MIIELYGPAGAGKTTLARAAAQALREKGHVVRVASSARPSETAGGARGGPPRLHAAMARAGKAVDVFTLVRALMPGRCEAARGFRALLAPTNAVWRLRFLRYLALLEETWNEARSSSDVTIFDQGYVSAVAGVFLRNQSCSQRDLEEVLRRTPAADVLVHVTGPADVIEARLRERLAKQSRLERLFELDPARARRQPGAFATLTSILARQDRAPIALSSLDGEGLVRSAQEIARQVEQAGAYLSPARDCAACGPKLEAERR